MEEKILATKKELNKMGDYAKFLIMFGVVWFIMAFWNKNRVNLLLSLFLLVVGVVLLCCFLMSKKIKLTVSDKRVFGSTVFGKRVDLPIDSISAVATSVFKGVAIGTSSGRISFKFVGNNKEIHSVISGLIIERQNKATVINTVAPEVTQSNADELKKYKDLLDMGAITQDEYDEKKKQLLGL